MFDPPVKNPVPTIYNLFTDPREEKPIQGKIFQAVTHSYEEIPNAERIRVPPREQASPADSSTNKPSDRAGVFVRDSKVVKHAPLLLRVVRRDVLSLIEV